MSAKLIEIGCTLEGVKNLMKGVTAFHRRERNALNLPLLAEAITGNLPAIVQIADGTHVKFRLNERTISWHRFVPSMAPDEQYEPLIVVAIDVAKVRDIVRGVETSTGST
ncbi:MAG: hypothetical protein J0M17_10800 [Planctomycetes bacterium]|nr:hypothetical protein [Planctomycetota bacterium]